MPDAKDNGAPAKPSTDDVLLANGFSYIRGECNGVLTKLRDIPPATIEAALDFIARNRDSAELKAHNDPAMRDNMDNEAREFTVLLEARRALVDADKKAIARAQIRP